MTELSRRDFLKGAAAAGLTAAGCAHTPDKHIGQEARHQLYTNARFVDLDHGTIKYPWEVLVSGGKIIHSGPPQKYSGVSAPEVMDLKGRYIMAGLMDAHCHLTLPSVSSYSPFLTLACWRQLHKNMENQLLSGVTHVRDMGAMPPILLTLMRKVKKGDLLGPEVIRANAIFNIKGGHPDVSPSDVSFLAGLGTLFTGAPTVDFEAGDLRQAFDENCRSADFVKLTMDEVSLIAGKPDIELYSDAQLRTIFDLAQAAGKPVAAHAMGRFGLRRTLNFPIHSLEHTVCDGPLSETDLYSMKERGVSVVPTTILGNLYTFSKLADPLPHGLESEASRQEAPLREAHFASLTPAMVEPAIHQNNLAMLDKLRTLPLGELYKQGHYTFNPCHYFPILTTGRDNLMRMRDAEIPIGCGTDAGVPFNYHGFILREMQCMQRLGFSKAEVLTAATKTNAKILGIESRAGSIEAGKEAHFIVMDDNPLANLSALNTLTHVVKHGQMHRVNAP